LVLLIAGNGVLGCGEVPVSLDLSPAQALRRSFPDQAGVVLAPPGEAFVATAEGFVLGAPAASSRMGRGVEVTLPNDGHGVIHLRGKGGVEVQVRELGALGEGTVEEHAVTYRRAGGRSFWTAAPNGVEEWLHLEAGAVRKDEPVAAWEVEGATVRMRGEVADLVDAGGVVRLSVTAPVAYAAGGRAIRAWLAGRATRLELWVEAEAHEVLVDPLWTTVAPMATGRFNYTATLLPNGQVLVVGGNGPGGALASAEL
jgi:hypothetical protein